MCFGCPPMLALSLPHQEALLGTLSLALCLSPPGINEASFPTWEQLSLHVSSCLKLDFALLRLPESHRPFLPVSLLRDC